MSVRADGSPRKSFATETGPPRRGGVTDVGRPTSVQTDSMNSDSGDPARGVVLATAEQLFAQKELAATAVR